MFLPIHLDETRTRYAYDDHIYLIVDVLPDATTRLESHEVGVEFAARFEGPDHPRASASRCGDLAEANRLLPRHTTGILARTTHGVSRRDVQQTHGVAQRFYRMAYPRVAS